MTFLEEILAQKEVEVAKMPLEQVAEKGKLIRFMNF